MRCAPLRNSAHRFDQTLQVDVIISGMDIAGHVPDKRPTDLIGDTTARHFRQREAAPRVDVHFGPDLLGVVVVVVRPPVPVPALMVKEKHPDHGKLRTVDESIMKRRWLHQELSQVAKSA
jgi:hypothetical protein